ncbi:ice-structuring glycoprotein-like [Sycon ciliatum]|uniref:ice-structuring glycoprotein-like n=1 Tax=Sycon ciliatum TaxID=27933 RepID=UPI0031F67C22
MMHFSPYMADNRHQPASRGNSSEQQCSAAVVDLGSVMDSENKQSPQHQQLSRSANSQQMDDSLNSALAIGRYSLGHGKGDSELYTEELREDGTEPGQADPWETLGEISEQQPQPIKRWKSMPTIAAKIKSAGAASPKCCDDEGHAYVNNWPSMYNLLSRENNSNKLVAECYRTLDWDVPRTCTGFNPLSATAPVQPYAVDTATATSAATPSAATPAATPAATSAATPAATSAASTSSTPAATAATASTPAAMAAATASTPAATAAAASTPAATAATASTPAAPAATASTPAATAASTVSTPAATAAIATAATTEKASVGNSGRPQNPPQPTDPSSKQICLAEDKTAAPAKHDSTAPAPNAHTSSSSPSPPALPPPLSSATSALSAIGMATRLPRKRPAPAPPTQHSPAEGVLQTLADNPTPLSIPVIETTQYGQSAYECLYRGDEFTFSNSVAYDTFRISSNATEASQVDGSLHPWSDGAISPSVSESGASDNLVFPATPSCVQLPVVPYQITNRTTLSSALVEVVYDDIDALHDCNGSQLHCHHPNSAMLDSSVQEDALHNKLSQSPPSPVTMFQSTYTDLTSHRTLYNTITPGMC